MDFITIPFLSVFVLPTLSSYSTRINLIFFYMTWTTLVLAHTALRVELFGTLAARLVFYLVPSLLFFLFDIAAPSTAVVFKGQGEAGLPTGNKRGKPTSKEVKVAGWALINFALGIAAQTATETFLIKIPMLKPAVHVTMSVPMPWDITKHLLWGFFVREHTPSTATSCTLECPIFALISTAHRAWHHSLRAPFPLTAHYDHPLAYLIGVFIPMYIPVMFLRFHMITFLVYTVLVSIEETSVFSGYYVIPSFLLRGIARRMEHHLSFGGKTYFGRWGFLDLITGTGGYADDDERGARSAGDGWDGRGSPKGRKK
ncbi:hypothetical protein BDW59DRAFT_174967 [Aspergillus cavernicola]|uniref:Fatty acid hydroxylase domain-containing protein n=1 Tax=Aspergillus cavernicola TaxID=176166 RepID=A0ABR4HU69_9EURO